MKGKARPCQAKSADPLLHVIRHLPGINHAGQIPLHIRQKHRHPKITERLRKNLQRHRLPGARCTRDQPMPICHRREQTDLPPVCRLSEINFAVPDHQNPLLHFRMICKPVRHRVPCSATVSLPYRGGLRTPPNCP